MLYVKKLSNSTERLAFAIILPAVLIWLILIIVFSSPAFAESRLFNTFEKGNTRASVSLANGSYFNDNYLIIGAGYGYYVANGLEVGVDLDIWTGGNPSIYELEPRLTYVFRDVPKFQPYIGLFYSRTFIENQSDSNSAGARAGLFFPVGKRTYIGFGVVYAELQSCTDTIFFDCSDSYTEFLLMFNL